MEIKTNGDYNRVQINFSQDKAADGQVIRQSVMVNVREDSVQRAYELYRELLQKIEGETEKSRKKDGKKKEDIGNPTCKCGNPMILRNGKSGMFYGCSAYPICRGTRPYKAQAELPADEDLVVADLPF